MTNRSNENKNKSRPKIAVALNIFLTAFIIMTIFNILYYVHDEEDPWYSALYFMAFGTRAKTVRGPSFSECYFNEVQNGMNTKEVLKLLYFPLEIDAVSESGAICAKQLRAYPQSCDSGLTKINYDNADKNCSPAYEVWKYTQPDPREKSYDVREIKFKSGRVVGKVMRFQK